MDKIIKIGMVSIFIICLVIILSASGLSQIQLRENKLENTKTEYEEQIILKQSELDSIKENLLQMAQDLQSIQSGDIYNLHDPTYKEVVSFIETERLTQNLGIDNNDNYFSLDYCININDRAESQGLRCAIIFVGMGAGGDYVIGFDTIDNDMVYYEPYIHGMIENLEIGKQYWGECVDQTYYLESIIGESLDTYYDYVNLAEINIIEPEWDDTISEILFYW